MPTRRIAHRARGPARAAFVLGLAALLLAGLVLAALLDATRDAGAPEQGATRPRTGGSTTTTLETVEPPRVDGAALNDTGFSRMQAGDYAGALTPLEQAVAALSGSGSLTEAYASYNLAYTRFALGSCDGVLALLDRSEGIQGGRREIDRLRRDAEKTCLAGKGDGRGRKNDEEGD